MRRGTRTNREDQRTTNAEGTTDRDWNAVAEVAEHATTRHPLAKGFVLGVLVAAAMAVFIVQNRDTTELGWLWFDFEARQWIALLVAFSAGGIAVPLLLFGVRRVARDRAEHRKALQRVQKRRGTSDAGETTRQDSPASGARG